MVVLFWIAVGVLFLRLTVAVLVLLREAWENR